MGQALVRDSGGVYLALRKVLSEEDILDAANDIIRRRFQRVGSILTAKEAMDFLYSQLIHHENEVFGGLFLDNRHRVIQWRILFTGTLDCCSVYPRVVLKEALAVNAAAVIFAHNHPSGDPEPSKADCKLTTNLRNALSLIEIRVLDHIIVGHNTAVSLAERGLL